MTAFEAQEAARRENAMRSMGNSTENQAQAFARSDMAQKALTAANERNPGAFKDIEIRDEYNPETNQYVKKGMLENEALKKKAAEASGMKALADSMGPDYSHVGDLGKFSGQNTATTETPPEMKSANTSASELASAKPSQAESVISKLKEEEKKGGPNFIDIIQAAMAGWNGQIPAYIKKAAAEDEQKKALERMQVQANTSEAERQASFADTQRLQADARKYDTAQFNAEMNLKREAAGLPPLGNIGDIGNISIGKNIAQKMLAGGK